MKSPSRSFQKIERISLKLPSLFLCSTCFISVPLYDKMKKLVFIAIVLFLSLLQLQAQQIFTVVIDPGHGGRDPGCVGTIVKEKSINLAVSLLLGNMIEQAHPNVNVIYTRRTDVFIPLDDRANLANRKKADLFISIHVNSVKKGNASGTETYTLGLSKSDENLEVAMRENAVITMEDDYLGKYEGFDPTSSESYIIFELMQNKHMEQSVSFASEIQKSFVRASRGDRGVRQAGLLVLRKTGMPSVLVELGFLSNRTEERFLASKEGQVELAQSIFKAFSNFKDDYDRKSGDMNGRSVEIVAPPTNPNETNEPVSDKIKSSATPREQDGIIYKVQILTSDKKLSVKDKRFKGYNDIAFYEEKGVYKYTYGATPDYDKILRMYRKASKDFKGAFIIKMQNNKRVN